MMNYRKLIKASHRSWSTMVPANTVRFLHVPVRRTIWELEIGTVKLTVVHQSRPAVPESFRESTKVPDLAPDLWKTINDDGS